MTEIPSIPTTIYTGGENLSVMSRMTNYNQWIYDTIAPHLGVSILEAGCGNGNITTLLLKTPHLQRYIGIDIEPTYCESLKKTFAPNTKIPIDFRALSLEKDILTAAVENPVDTVVCLNVLEHIEKDRRALDQFHNVLKPNGSLILQVPAFQALYGTIDRIDGHFRRYSRYDLEQKVQEAGFQVTHAFYFNLFGIFAWIWHGKIRKLEMHPTEEVKLFDMAVKILSKIEKIARPPVGLSLFVIAKKNTQKAKTAGQLEGSKAYA